MRIFIGCLAIFVILAMHIPPAKAEQMSFFSTYPDFDQKQWQLSDGWTNGDHQSCEWKADALSAVNGNLQLRLSDQGGKLRPLGCAEIQSTARTTYGRYEARMRAAAGAGLNTAFFTYIGPPLGVPSHDEIDFEFLGKNTHAVEITCWKDGKKCDNTVIPLEYDSSAEFHNYAFEWTPSAIRWYIDDHLVHETPAGVPMPENASHIYLSLWSGSSLEDSWMGHFVYTKPVTAEVAWVKYTPDKE
jgi:endo-1,3-1,4-beta-glycanase ExoK